MTRMLPSSIALLFLVAVPALAFAATRPLLHPPGEDTVLHGGVPATAKSAVDSFLLMGPGGSGAPYVGDFEGVSGCAWNGWTSVDHTAPEGSHWQVADYFPVSGSLSAWCGSLAFPSCGEPDPDGGYGNDWSQMLEWRGVVDDPGRSTAVQIEALLDVDTEPAYDFVHVSVEKPFADLQDLATWDGQHSGLVVQLSAGYQPGEYVGAGGDEVVVLFRFESDGAWSDEDCSYPTAGAVRVDDVSITTDNGAASGLVDFEDGTFGTLAPRVATGVGDFAQLMSGLHDIDPCRENPTCQVVFIDDGLVVPGTGGTLGTTWTYGPGGYVLNSSGGLLGPSEHLNNSVVSPPMAWPDPAHQGCLLEYDMYAHEPLGTESPGMFPTWGVRWTASADPADLASEPWSNNGFVSLYPVGVYMRPQRELDHLMPTQPQWMQVRLGVYEAGWIWGWTGTDATPAPYYDNVRVTTYERVGPSLSAREVDLAQDTFPESGLLDPGDPGMLNCRFDMARNISVPSHLRNDPGDTLVVDSYVNDPDCVQEGPPRLHYKVFRNPLFAPYVTAVLPDEGWVEGQQATAPGGAPIEGRFFCDLPDSGFLFPGDEVHYFFSSSQRNQTSGEVTTALLPADTTGFAARDGDPYPYPPVFTMRCLPTVSDMAGSQPPVLLWYDQPSESGRDEWHHALHLLGGIEDVNYDCYTTTAAASGVGNGLGGRASPQQLAGYRAILYSSGAATAMTLGNGDFNGDPSQDVALLATWLAMGDHNLLVTGDHVASDLTASGEESLAFLHDVLGATLLATPLRDLIGGQSSPRVVALPDNGVLNTVSSLIIDGGCPSLRTFDPLDPVSPALCVAEYADPSGTIGTYSVCAMVVNEVVLGPATSYRTALLPYDLDAVLTDPLEGAIQGTSLPARARLLRDVLDWFAAPQFQLPYSGTPAAEAFTVDAAPNPFNPQTVIHYSVPAAGRLTLRVYDLRGRLVRTVLDRRVTTSGKVAWDGRDDRGAQVASGVYFYEARLRDDARVGKLTLLK